MSWFYCPTHGESFIGSHNHPECTIVEGHGRVIRHDQLARIASVVWAARWYRQWPQHASADLRSSIDALTPDDLTVLGLTP